LVEAGIDFSDEADVARDVTQRALVMARELEKEISSALADGKRGERLRDGLVVAIAGPPNAGKSTLLNRIARREAAIVSPYAGTTRDVIEVHLDLHGFPVTLLDTAGIRDSDDPVEREGVSRARARAAQADLVLWVIDASQEVNIDSPPLPSTDGPPAWMVRNKIDLVAEQRPRNKDRQQTKKSNRPIKSEDRPFYELSATTGAGLESLVAALGDFVRNLLEGREPALVTRERHRHALEETAAALQRALNHSAPDREALLAEELRLAARALGRLTGRVDVEDILDVIFRDFCIGK
jgi:tRNA modification GTPase